MTNDELLALLDSREINEESDTSNYLALRAVVLLHRWENKHRGMGLKQRCPECGFAYPCPTIKAITKETT